MTLLLRINERLLSPLFSDAASMSGMATVGRLAIYAVLPCMTAISNQAQTLIPSK